MKKEGTASVGIVRERIEESSENWRKNHLDT
jgi:hypothetical protein